MKRRTVMTLAELYRRKPGIDESVNVCNRLRLFRIRIKDVILWKLWWTSCFI